MLCGYRKQTALAGRACRPDQARDATYSGGMRLATRHSPHTAASLLRATTRHEPRDRVPDRPAVAVIQVRDRGAPCQPCRIVANVSKSISLVTQHGHDGQRPARRHHVGLIRPTRRRRPSTDVPAPTNCFALSMRIP